VAEGFSDLMRNVMNLNMFKAFGFGLQGMEISHLQCADDTLYIRRATMENLWTLKALLRGFHIATELKVDLIKCLK